MFDKVILSMPLLRTLRPIWRLCSIFLLATRRTSVIYIVTSATSQNNIDLFNETSRESLGKISGKSGGTFSSSMLYAVAKIMRGVSEAGNPAIGLKDLRNISAMSPMDARRMYPDVNPQNIETDEGAGDIEYKATPAQRMTLGGCNRPAGYPSGY